MRALALITLALILVACSGGEGASPASAGTSDGGGTPEPIGPITTRGGGGSPADSGGGSGQLTVDLPADWTEETPSSPMRQMQASIPGEAGPGQIAMFHFPGQGGSVEANLTRWIGQMEMAPGDQPRRETFESNGLRVTWLDVAGTMLPSTMGVGPTERQPNFRMLAAVIEGPGGPWFFKATGPDATLAAQRDAFVEMLRGLSAA
ncbi:MAG: hypothetical protein AAF604_01540 [Acidobacteriota bacterium]